MVRVAAPGPLGHEAGRREGRSQGRAAASGAQTAHLSCRSISEWAGAREVFAVESAGHLSACAHQTREAGQGTSTWERESPIPCPAPHPTQEKAPIARPWPVREGSVGAGWRARLLPSPGSGRTAPQPEPRATLAPLILARSLLLDSEVGVQAHSRSASLPDTASVASDPGPWGAGVSTPGGQDPDVGWAPHDPAPCTCPALQPPWSQAAWRTCVSCTGAVTSWW